MQEARQTRRSLQVAKFFAAPGQERAQLLQRAASWPQDQVCGYVSVGSRAVALHAFMQLASCMMDGYIEAAAHQLQYLQNTVSACAWADCSNSGWFCTCFTNLLSTAGTPLACWRKRVSAAAPQKCSQMRPPWLASTFQQVRPCRGGVVW